ncbi:putative transcriptional regulator [Xenococcus sp. PCC 7305]|uniref:GntR family transcriptional regulator n=1 Tax=Xenococcus sp. PCC 7305 TaxID=102125 RepID=UPI0002AC48C1|nr:GntR family transcriptional regulator [Xenococcus sp. PCC 7305]ELS04409.1 putative transcriptional regulator [Xenococcus sp. PCC 7305]
MLNFQIHTDSDVPASKQLFAQIQFAIASGQYPTGHRLPSTRQLAMITGLHRNTISKVYQNLEEKGLVESVAGSGIYVKNPELETTIDSPTGANSNLIQETIDNLLEQGCNLTEIRELLIEEIDWRLRCQEKVIITVPRRDLSAGEIMHQELTESLKISVDLVTLEKLSELLEETNFGTLITNRYFLKEVLEIVPANSFRIIPVDIYDYSKELAMIKKLPSQARLGIVSLSESTLKIAESIVRSQRGEDILVLTAPQRDRNRLMTVIRNAHTIITGPSSYDSVKEALASVKADLIRLPEIICSDKYISPKSISLLKKELLH